MELNSSHFASLLNCPLFAGFTATQLQALLQNKGSIKSYEKGQIVYDPTHFKKEIGIITRGMLEAYSPTAQTDVLLTRMTAGFVVGIAALFNVSDKYVSSVVAKENSTLYFLTQQEVETLMQNSFPFTKNYLGFLSNRITFLNKRIQTFTSSSAEEKLLFFLQWQKDEENTVKIPMTKLASMLGLGRASLYRALDELTQKGKIKKIGQKLYIYPEEQNKKEG